MALLHGAPSNNTLYLGLRSRTSLTWDSVPEHPLPGTPSLYWLSGPFLSNSKGSKPTTKGYLPSLFNKVLVIKSVIFFLHYSSFLLWTNPSYYFNSYLTISLSILYLIKFFSSKIFVVAYIHLHYIYIIYMCTLHQQDPWWKQNLCPVICKIN